MGDGLIIKIRGVLASVVYFSYCAIRRQTTQFRYFTHTMQNGKVSSRAICSLRPFEVELMNSSFTYMGTKHRISDQVADIICRSPDGPILDLFAGVSAVGKALIEERPVWCNDIQHFAFNVAGAFFTSKSGARLSISRSRNAKIISIKT